MRIVDIQLPDHAYRVHIGPGLLTELGELAADAVPASRAALLVDSGIETSHGRIAMRSLQRRYQTTVGVVPTGEEHKTLGTVRSLYDILIDARLERRCPVVALGGGVTGDTAGFVAASYLRGVPFIQCPTTLLAMVDASVGGKVGVNLPQGKNLIGAFHQPALVIADTHTLRTLPGRELRCGLAECIKHAVIADPELFDFIEQHHEALLSVDDDLLVELVERNVRIKAGVVEADEREAGIRAHLNFGHTFAHAIESLDYGRLHHGEAVAVGMLAATRLSVRLGLCPESLVPRLDHLIQAVGLPAAVKQLPAGDEMLARMRLDKKVADGRIRLVLTEGPGRVRVSDDVAPSEIAAVWDTVRG